MAFKEIYKSKEARTKLKEGIDIGADVAKVTIGPSGRNVIVDRGVISPLSTNDGYKSIQGIILKDRAQNMGLDILKDVVKKTSDTARGARTASIILTQSIVDLGLNAIDKDPNINVISLKKELKDVSNKVIENLKGMSIEVNTIQDIKNVATISSESEEIGVLVATALNQIGKEGTITTEEIATQIGVTTEITQGMRIDKGWVDSYMVTNYEKMNCEYSNVGVILVDKKLLMIKEIQGLLEVLGEKGVGEILLIAEEIEGEVLNTIIANKLKGGFKIVGVKIPGNGPINRKEILKDIAILTGATVLGNGVEASTAGIDTVGFSSKIIVGQESSVILGNPEMKNAVLERIDALKEQIKGLKSKVEIDMVKDRIARLSGGAAIIKVGTATTVGTGYLKDKIDDAITEAKAAYEEGILPGGGSALLRLGIKLNRSKVTLAEGIIADACLAPFKQIVENSGGNFVDLMTEIGKNLDSNIGYDALNHVIVEDMVKTGIIDSYKVVRIALENAVEGASTVLTTEVVVADEAIINNNKN